MTCATSDTRPHAVAALCLLIIGLQIAGCGIAGPHAFDRQYDFVHPSLVSLERGKIPCPAEAYVDGSTATGPLHASDELVLRYAACIKKMLRARMPPAFMRMFGAGHRARAYAEGVHLIEDAQAQYLAKLASQPDPALGSPRKVPASLTPAGAELFLQVVVSLKLVENLLVARLPSIEDIQLARGKVRRIAQVKVALSQTTNKPDVAATAQTDQERTVVYTATAKNVTESALGPAVLEIRVRDAKSWKQQGNATNAACENDGPQDLRCTITSLAAGAVVKVGIEAVAPRARLNPQSIRFSSQVWDDSTKLPLSGPEHPLVVEVDKQ